MQKIATPIFRSHLKARDLSIENALHFLIDYAREQSAFA